MTKIVPPEKAKQGRKGTPVLVVLVVALVLAAIGWWGVELYGERIDTRAQEQTTQPAQPE